MTELFLNGTRVDVMEDVAVPLNYAIAELKDPFSRSGAYSRTVKIPASPTVNILFDHIFEINSDIQNTSTTNFNPDFNPNLKTEAIVKVDTIEQFRGYMRLRSITRDKNDLDRMYYNVELFGELGNLVFKMADNKLTELDFSEFNHTYNRTNQRASWALTYTNAYFYPMIDNGLNDLVNWRVEHFFPAIYARQYWDKIFAYVGCYYSGSFATAAPFTKLAHPFTGDSFKLTSSQITARKFVAQLSADIETTGTTTFGSLAEPVVFDNEISDPDAQYNPATGYFTCVDPGFYELVLSSSYYWEAVGANVVNNPYNAWLNVLVYHQRGATTTLVSGAAVHNDFSTILSGNTSSTVSFTYTSLTQECQVGDTMWIKLVPVCFPTSGGANLKFHLESTGTSFYNTIQNASIVEGGTLDLNAAIPNDIRMADYFLSIVKEFNLMVEPDRTKPNTFRIDTADDFYSSGTTRDWTSKLDVSKEWEQFPMGALDAKRYVMKRTDSDDYFNKAYRDQWQETYGMKKHDVNNDFLKDENVFESIFIDSPLVGRTSDDRVYPAIYTVDSNGTAKAVTGGMRILYVGGAVNTGYQWNYVTNSATHTETTYPYAGHLDNVANPTFDLCFDKPKMVYYTAVNYTDANLWNLYHWKYINEITNRNSKLVTAWFYLRPKDILTLSFSDPIWIKDAYYRLQKVIDYDANKDQSTKCELLKIINGSEFVGTTYTIGNYNGSVQGVDYGVLSRPKPRVSYFDDTNKAASGTERVTIVGSSGVTVYPELRNVTVINTNDVTITENDTVWINGSRYDAGSNSVQNIATSATISQAGTYYCTGTITVTLSPATISQQSIIQIYNVGTGTVTVSGGGYTIRYSAGNSVASFALTGQYDSLTLQYNSTYFIMR